MPRRPVNPDRRTRDDFARICDRMPVIIRQRARELYDRLSDDELYTLYVTTGVETSDLSQRDLVYLAEELVRRERQFDSIDEILKDNEEDYAATE